MNHRYDSLSVIFTRIDLDIMFWSCASAKNMSTGNICLFRNMIEIISSFSPCSRTWDQIWHASYICQSSWSTDTYRISDECPKKCTKKGTVPYRRYDKKTYLWQLIRMALQLNQDIRQLKLRLRNNFLSIPFPKLLEYLKILFNKSL